jgi:phage terminase large subunit-like protein
VGKDENFFVNEHCDFPDNTDHDDCVDVSSLAAHVVGLPSRFSMSYAELPLSRRT